MIYGTKPIMKFKAAAFKVNIIHRQFISLLPAQRASFIMHHNNQYMALMPVNIK